MARQLSLAVDIFHDFDDAEAMETTCCRQVSEDQYQNDMRLETGKALRELCQYLDHNPEVYARVLRKRKQEELENGGIVSYIKSKVMRLMYGEQYFHHLVSASDCRQRTNALKTCMNRTFQFSQGLEEEERRQTPRLVARRHAQTSITRFQPINLYKWKAQDTSSSTLFSNIRLKSSDSADKTDSITRSGLTTLPSTDKTDSLIRSGLTTLVSTDKTDLIVRSDRYRPNSGMLLSDHATENPSKAPKIAIPVAVVKNMSHETGKEKQGPFAFGNIDNRSAYVHIEKVKDDTYNSNTGAIKDSPTSKSEVSSNKPQHLPPSPVSANLIASVVPKQSSGDTRRSSIDRERHSSPRLHSVRASSEIRHTRASSVQNLSSQSGSPKDGLFLTPDIPARFKTRKRSLSNSSGDSHSSHGSLSSESSERRSSKPVRKQKAAKVAKSNSSADFSSNHRSLSSVHSDTSLLTPVVQEKATRSGDGTPVQSEANTLSSAPLHKALLAAMKTKIKKINARSLQHITASNNSAPLE